MKAGFTLVEVMVAVAIASLLIVGVAASTQGTIRTAERQKSDAKSEELRARAIELFRQDWRGRVRVVKPALSPPVGVGVLAMSTTADSLAAPNDRGTRLVRYTVSEKGLSRNEGQADLSLLPGPVLIDYWDGVAWRTEFSGKHSAVRLQFQNPEEVVVFR